ncbi:MAG TPA: YheC/YheD family protein [Bacillota bacterium]|nr:YheC/YheD family protein [Bacillota bacterium]HPP86135.1 YheC/YheD family protein [Bacillota bacterium]
MKTCKIKTSESKKNTVELHPDTAAALGIATFKKAVVKFGILRHFADVVLNGEVAETELILSTKLASNLHIPDFPDYEVKVSGNEIEFGPFIGMLMSSEDKRLTWSLLERMKVYLSDYENLHGAVVFFALDKADDVGRLIEGYCYRPDTKTFEKGIFPFPASMYRSIGLSDRWKNCFLTAMGDRFFNSHYFSKWEMYQWYSANPAFAGHVPFTNILRTADDVFEMLERYGKAFIKPVSGLGGHGITQAAATENGYEFKYREKGENIRALKAAKEEAAEYIKIRFGSGRCLVQQPIDLIKVNDCVIDFRCIAQKNRFGKWVCMAVIGRYGKKGSIVSNISSGGTAFILGGPDSPLQGAQAAHLFREISAFAMKVCSALDEYGLNIGTVGIDIGVDKNGGLWLIEINNRDPDPTIALDANDRDLYLRLKTGILAYAKFLAGF